MSIYACIIGIVVCIINKFVLRKYAPKYRFVIFYIIFLFLICPISFSNKYSIYNFFNITFWKERNYNIENYLNVINIDNNPLQEMTINNRINSMQNYIVIIWFIISVFLVISKIFCYMKLSKEDNEVKDKYVNEIFIKSKRECNINKNIKLCVSNKVSVPSIYGLYNVKIFIPEDLLDIDNVKLKNIIKHEIYHYKRKDNILNYIMIFLKSIYWFNPIVSLLLRTIKENMEFATDELVTKDMSKNECKDYCKTLLGVSIKKYELLEYTLGFISKKEEVEKRIDNIIGKEHYYNYNNIKKVLSGVVCICLILFLSPIEKNEVSDNIYVKTSRNQEYKLISKDSITENIINISIGDYIKLINNNRNIVFRNLTHTDIDGVIENWTMKAYTEKGEYCYEIINEINNNNYYLKVIVE